LATFPQLDSYAPRRSPRTSYFGIWPLEANAAPSWPSGPGRKILAYLKPFAALPLLLEQLRRLQATSLVVCPNIDPQLAQLCHNTRVQIVPGPVDLPAAIAACDVAIGHGTHGFTACALEAGRPQLMIPLMLEQRLTATCVKEQGAGLVANPKHARQVILSLRTLWEDGSFSARAQAVGNSLHGTANQDRVGSAVATILGTA
jgi:UDP:flavonoid glycosyltransferase YjiC (YdhE family)